MKYSVAKLAEKYDLSVSGNLELEIEGVCGISDNRLNHLSFVSHKNKIEQAIESEIQVFLAPNDFKIDGKTTLCHEFPEFIFCKISSLFLRSQIDLKKRAHQNTVISESSIIDSTVEIGANVVIGDEVKIDSNTKIFPNCVIMDRCDIGKNCVIYPNCTLREDTVLGNNVILQPGVSVGGDGYGFFKHKGKYVKIPQLGNVVISDNVEIGANSAIDRGRFSKTFIGAGTKIDNLVMVGHNVFIGENCLIVSQVGISGSTKLGDRVTLAGQVGTAGHVEIGDDVTVLGKGGVTKSLPEAGFYAGMPARPAKIWRRAIASLYSQLKPSK